MRAQAQRTAEILARACVEYRGGRRRPVAHPAAVAALQRAFARSLAEGGDVVVMRIDDATARAFPGYTPQGAPPEARAWLAVGFDALGHGAYCVRHVLTPAFLDPMNARRLVEARMRAEIAPELARPGFPVEVAADG